MSQFDLHAERRDLRTVSALFYTINSHHLPVYDPVARQTLVALAQTCRALSELSLDCLWRTLNSLEPLIRCYTSLDDVENIIPPTSSQFAIIERYSYRVKDVTISKSACLRFLECISMRPFYLFPNLVALQWGPYLRDPLPIVFIQPLLTPALQSLQASFSEADEATLLSFFDNLAFLCPDLKSIEFRFPVEPQSLMTRQALSRAICSQKALEKVVLRYPVDDVTLIYLSTLPTLTDFTAKLAEISRSHSFLPSDPLFCNVEEFEFETSDLDLVTSLLRPRDQIFYTFCLDYHGRLTSEAALAFLNLLASPSRTEPPGKFSLSTSQHCDPTPVDQMASEAPHYRLTYETLQPLMLFDSLRFLTIEWSDQISLDDDALANLARSWPRLRTFNFRCGYGGYPPYSTKYPTLGGLLALVRSCPELHMASLPLDATRIPEVEVARPCGPVFGCLLVPESPIGDPLPVAEFLFRSFCHVRQVEGLFGRPPATGTDVLQINAYEQRWRNVVIHLEDLRRS